MLIKVITLMFDSAYGGFNDAEIREFLKDKDLISSTDQFFARNDIPYLVFVLRYFPHRKETDAKSAAATGKQKPASDAWKENLSEHDMGLFNLLRDWRSQRCKKDGVPPYVVFTNRELAEVVKRRPQSIAELTQIDGVGKAKAQKYAEDILAFTKVTEADEVQEVFPIVAAQDE